MAAVSKANWSGNALRWYDYYAIRAEDGSSMTARVLAWRVAGGSFPTMKQFRVSSNQLRRINPVTPRGITPQ